MGETKSLNESTGSKKVFTIYHVPWHLYVVMLGIVLACIYTNVVPFDLPAGVGYLVGFYPIEAGISAGLCMANRGGSGDIAVLGASKPMALISYAQISSRLGGAIILVIASIMFSIFLG